MPAMTHRNPPRLFPRYTASSSAPVNPRQHFNVAPPSHQRALGPHVPRGTELGVQWPTRSRGILL